MSHRYLHQGAQLDSIYNVILQRSSKLMLSAMKSQLQLVHDMFAASPYLVYTSAGYNSVCNSHHRKVYTEQDYLCAKFIHDVRLTPDQNNHLFGEVYHICTC